MYSTILVLHSILRWLAAIGALLALGRALYGWLGKKQWGRSDDRLGMLFTTSMDFQVLIGFVLYFVSPLTRGVLADFGAAMGDSTLRFFGLFHGILMLAAVALAHMGRSLSRKAEGETRKFRTAALFYGGAILVVLIAIPWPFGPYARPWLRL